MNHILKLPLGWVALGWLVLAPPAAVAVPIGTTLTYQGSLANGSNPANGLYDLRFKVYDAATNGSLVAGPVTGGGVVVNNGRFTVSLDFGAVFAGDARWLGLEVRTNNATTFSALAPRQALTPTPQALFATAAGTANSAASANYAPTAGTAQNVPWYALPAPVLTNAAAFDPTGAAIAAAQNATNSLNPAAFTGNAATATNWTGVFDVTAFGAVGDGVTDCHKAIEAAMQAALVKGGLVYFPARPGRSNIYADSGPHYLFATNFPTWPVPAARPFLKLKGEPQVTLLATMTNGVFLSGFFDIEDLIILGQGQNYGTWPYPTNYVGVFLIGPWGCSAHLRNVALFRWGEGLSLYEAQPHLYNVQVEFCLVGIALGRQNDSMDMDSMSVYNCSVGLETGTITPYPTNSPVGPITSWAVTGSSSARIKGLWDYNGVDIVLGARYGTYELQIYGEATTNCNLMIGHDPATWPALAAAEAGGYIKAKLNTCNWNVNSPTNVIKLFNTAVITSQNCNFGGSTCQAAIRSFTAAGDRSTILFDETTFGPVTNYLSSAGHAITDRTFKLNCSPTVYYWNGVSGF